MNQSVSMGTGVIIGETDDQVIIVSNQHVVTGADTLSVAFIDETAADAQILGEDADTDLAIIDAGMTPYQLPKPITYLIGIRDFLMTMMGKYASIKMLGSVFDPEKYSQEDLLYVKKVLNSLSARTIWRGFYEANNYTLPEDIAQPDCRIQYWYGDEEKDARGWDMEFVKKTFPNVHIETSAKIFYIFNFMDSLILSC